MTNYEDKICVSVRRNTFEQTLDALENLSFAEVRLDDLDLSEEQLARIFSIRARLIATARPGHLSEDRRTRILAGAAALGARYVDVELEAAPTLCRTVLSAAAQSGCRIIVSYHDFHATPARAELVEIVERCFALGAHIAKVACHAQNERDAARLLGLLGDKRGVVPLGMGPAGRLTRIIGPLLGAPFTFASQEGYAPTAPGQLTRAQLVKAWQELAP